MGLFGIYTKKDFEKRTKAFKEKLKELCSIACQIDGYKKILTKLVIVLDCSEYPKGKSVKQAEIKEIDDRIDALITSLKQDAQDENAPRFACHAKFILRAIEDSRQYGKEKYDKRYLENEEAMATAAGEIHNISKRKTIVEQERIKLLEEAKKSLSSSKEGFHRIELQYSALEREENELSGKLYIWQSRYDNAVKAEAKYYQECESSPLASSEILAKSEELKALFEDLRMETKRMYSSCESSSFDENAVLGESKNATSKDSEPKPDLFLETLEMLQK